MLPGADVVKIVSSAPNILVYDVTTSIPPKLDVSQPEAVRPSVASVGRGERGE